MKTAFDAIKREVDASVWCDSIEWRGQEVTLRKSLSTIPLEDITGSSVVKRWIQDLREVNPRKIDVTFKIKNYGCVRQRDPKLVTPAVKTRTHCFATFIAVIK